MRENRTSGSVRGALGNGRSYRERPSLAWRISVIEFLHSAPYLYHEDAYRDYCWAVDAWGAQQPSSFIYLCSEAFATFCAEVGIHIVPSSHNLGLAQKGAFPTKAEANSVSPTQPELDGLIIRITSERDLSLIRRYLDLG